MNRLVMDLLSLAKLEGGTADLQQGQVDLEVLLNAMVDKFTLQAQQANIHLTRHISKLPVWIGDGDRISQVFINLLDNALKFTPPGGFVSLLAEVNGDHILVSVKDNGIGISPEDQPRIFERFFQIDKSRQGGTGRGVGLGLAIARQIVLSHGGKIWVTSNPGEGSTFFVQLPLPSPEPAKLSFHRPKG
jgi:signal transduction histidine kinase